MNFNYQFSNLLGTVYRRGNLTFSPDGNTLFSPVGNKISAFDLKTHKSETLNIEGTERDWKRNSNLQLVIEIYNLRFTKGQY